MMTVNLNTPGGLRSAAKAQPAAAARPHRRPAAVSGSAGSRMEPASPTRSHRGAPSDADEPRLLPGYWVAALSQVDPSEVIHHMAFVFVFC